MAYQKRSAISQVFSVPGFVFGFFFLIGAVFAVVGVFALREGRTFVAEGVDVMGQVEDRWQTTRDCSDSSSSSRTRSCTDFNVGYSFAVAGKTFHNSATTDYATYAGLEQGSPVLVRYLASDPGRNATSFDPQTVSASGGQSVLGLIFGGLGGAFVLIGGGGLAWLLRASLRAVGLRDTGTARGAVVLACEETNVKINNRRQWRIRWKDDTGALGQSRAQAPDQLPQAGDRITVYADPEGRLPAVWEGDSGTR